MKMRESGMPAEAYWESLFDVPAIGQHFGFEHVCGDVAELGCGYGTFTVPIAMRIGGVIHAYGIDSSMIDLTRRRAAGAGCTNVRPVLRDVFEGGFDVLTASCEAVVLFNILHGEQPLTLLHEARRILRPGGFVAVIHWRTDLDTPRGPNASIRPPPEQIQALARATGAFSEVASPVFLPPWHYGIELVAV